MNKEEFNKLSNSDNLEEMEKFPRDASPEVFKEYINRIKEETFAETIKWLDMLQVDTDRRPLEYFPQNDFNAKKAFKAHRKDAAERQKKFEEHRRLMELEELGKS